MIHDRIISIDAKRVLFFMDHKLQRSTHTTNGRFLLAIQLLQFIVFIYVFPLNIARCGMTIHY